MKLITYAICVTLVACYALDAFRSWQDGQNLAVLVANDPLRPHGYTMDAIERKNALIERELNS